MYIYNKMITSLVVYMNPALDNLSACGCLRNHHTLHLFAEFIGVFAGQLNAVENSLRFDKVPITL